MRVAIVNQHISQAVGGSELQSHHIATGLEEKGHDVLYVVPKTSRAQTSDCVYNVVFAGGSPHSIIREIENFHPDVVYWRYNKNSVRCVARKVREKGIPFVFAASHINDLLKSKVKSNGVSLKHCFALPIRRARAYWEHGAFEYVSRVTVNNKEFVGILSYPTTDYIPNGTYCEYLPFSWPRPFVAWVSNIKPSKRPECLIQLAHDLNVIGMDLIMVGAIQSSRYRWFEDSEKLPRNLVYLGIKSPKEVNGILLQSRLHVHTCRPEGFPNVMLQAWKQQRPSVSLEVDPSGTISKHQIGAVAGGDVKRFRSLVVEWARSPRRCDDAGRRAKMVCEREFSMSQMVSSLERTLIDVIEK